ncbi:S41 family peptidase [Pseudoneobacillus sp. C159]
MLRYLMLFILLTGLIGCSPGLKKETVIPLDLPQDQKKAVMTTTQHENLYAFAKLYGYIKYFHPSDEVTELDWNEFAIYGVERVLPAKDTLKLEMILKELFLPIAPTMLISTNQKELEQSLIKAPKSLEEYSLIAWEHSGVSGPNEEVNSMYESKRVQSEGHNEIQVFDHTLQGGESFIKQIHNQLFVKVPLVLYSKDSQTFGAKSSRPFEELVAKIFEYNVADEHILHAADLVVTWNVLQHFYPYFHTINTDWEEELTIAIQEVLSGKEFEGTLTKMLATLHDGHIRVEKGYNQRSYLPIGLDEVEGQIVVSNVEEIETIKPGDILLSIDGEAVKEKLQLVKTHISGSSQWTTFIALRELVSTQTKSSSQLEVKRGNEILEVQVPYSKYLVPTDPFKRQASFSRVSEGIIYINLSESKIEEFIEHLPTLENADGVIFDLRGYPKSSIEEILQYLTQQPLQSAIWKVPQIVYPDHEKTPSFNTDGRWLLEPKKPKLSGKIVFLTNSAAISYSESIMGIVEHYQLGEIVGQPTAGANGNVNWIGTPSGWAVYWTGMEVIKNDGTQHHLIGIQPTVPLVRTISAMASGRDEYLDRAIEIIRSQ